MSGKDSLSIDDATLEAFVDGRLGPADAARVSDWLAAHPEKAAEVEAMRQQNAAMAALFSPVANEPVPARLDVRRIAGDVRGERRASWRLAAAAVVLLGLGAGVGWYGRDALTPVEAASDILIDTAVTAHVLYVNERRHAVEVAAAEEDHLVTWLSNRVGQPFNAPDLAAQGFTLVGGRLLPPGLYENAGPAAQLMYENAAAQRVTVYITGALPDRAQAYESVRRSGVDAVYWASAVMTCTIVGDLPEPEMQLVARQVYAQLTRRADGAGEW